MASSTGGRDRQPPQLRVEQRRHRRVVRPVIRFSGAEDLARSADQRATLESLRRELRAWMSGLITDYSPVRPPTVGDSHRQWSLTDMSKLISFETSCI